MNQKPSASPQGNKTAPSPIDQIKQQLKNLPLQAKLGFGMFAVFLASLGIFRTHDTIDPHAGEQPASDLSDLGERKQISDFELTTFDGKTVHISDFKRQVVMLNFWSVRSAPSLNEIQQLATLRKKYLNQGLVLIPINTDDDETERQTAKEFWKNKGFDFPSYTDTNDSLSQAFGVDQIPSNFVLDRVGKMVFSSIGSNDWANPLSWQPVLDLLSEKFEALK